jgi:hypothetical protein
VWRGIGEDIFTQGKTVDELYANIREAVTLHFEDRAPASDIDILVVSELKFPIMMCWRREPWNDLLARVSLWNGIPKEELIERLR